MNVVSALVICAAAIGVGACQLARDLLPRTHTVSTSPDGRIRAFVRQHLSSDPLDDHLYLVPPGERPRHLMELAPDADWCRSIIWTPDSRKVGFLINSQRLAVFNGSTGELDVMLVLVKADGYPGTQEAKHVALIGDGSAVSFERVERPTIAIKRRRDGRRLEVLLTDISQPPRHTRLLTPGRSLGHETLEVPRERLRLHPLSGDNMPFVDHVWVRLETPDGRKISVSVTPDTDGIVRLPAFDAGPFSIVEVTRRGRSMAVLHGVEIGHAPVQVTVS